MGENCSINNKQRVCHDPEWVVSNIHTNSPMGEPML